MLGKACNIIQVADDNGREKNESFHPAKPQKKRGWQTSSSEIYYKSWLKQPARCSLKTKQCSNKELCNTWFKPDVRVWRKSNQSTSSIAWNNFLTIKSQFGSSIYFIGEFDPGSGRTLAACLTHASRTDLHLTLSFLDGLETACDERTKFGHHAL